MLLGTDALGRITLKSVCPSLYNYINERLMEVIDLDKEDGVWEEDRKTAYDYEGDWIYSRRYNKEGEDWVEQNYGSTEGIKIVDGKVVEVKYTNTFWVMFIIPFLLIMEIN